MKKKPLTIEQQIEKLEKANEKFGDPGKLREQKITELKAQL